MYNISFLGRYHASIRHSEDFFKTPHNALLGEEFEITDLDRDNIYQRLTLLETPKGGGAKPAEKIINLLYQLGDLEIPYFYAKHFSYPKAEAADDANMYFVKLKEVYPSFDESVNQILHFLDLKDRDVLAFLPLFVFAYIFNGAHGWERIPQCLLNKVKLTSLKLPGTDFSHLVDNLEDLDDAEKFEDFDAEKDNYRACSHEFSNRILLPHPRLLKYKRSVHNGVAPIKADSTYFYYEAIVFLKILQYFGKCKLESGFVEDYPVQIIPSALVFNHFTFGLLDMLYNVPVLTDDGYPQYSELLYDSLVGSYSENADSVKIYLEDTERLFSPEAPGSINIGLQKNSFVEARAELFLDAIAICTPEKFVLHNEDQGGSQCEKLKAYVESAFHTDFVLLLDQYSDFSNVIDDAKDFLFEVTKDRYGHLRSATYNFFDNYRTNHIIWRIP